MNRKLYVLFSLVVMASMIFSACTAATPTAAPQATDAPVVAEPTEAQATEAVEPTATEASTEPTTEAEPTATTAASSESGQKGAWVDKVIFTAIADSEPAVAQLQAGTIDMYPVSVEDAAVFETVQGDDTLGYYNVYGSSNQNILNTVACADTTKLNPFTDMQIREAMNWATDRTYIAQEIMGGLARPKFSPFYSTFPDYARYADKFAEIESRYAYNFDQAQEVVDARMAELGATKGSDGKWQYNGQPVTLIALIRTEDKRREIGNYFADQLEDLGFTVDRQEKTRSEAGPIWQGEPSDCAFHFYTAGWIANGVTRDEGNNFIQYNTGEIQQIPLFNEYQPSARLKEIGDALNNNSFATMEERGELVREGLDLAMTESWWGIWVSDNAAFSPYKQGIQVASDLAGGVAAAQLWPYTLRIEGQTGGEVRIAQSGILVQPWNPVSGSNWTDDAMIQRGTQDYGVVLNPYTGLNMPKLVERAELTVEEGLPVVTSSDWVTLDFATSIPVPEDAWADWDAENQKWITVGEKFPDGVTAKTKQVVYYKPELWSTTWHDGSNMSMGDFLTAMILGFDQAKPESPIYDETLVPVLDSFLSHFKGVKIVSTDPLVIETYDDTFGLDAENTVTTWYPVGQYGQFAWHNLVPGMLAEAEGRLAFTTDKAQATEVEWTSLIAGPSLETQAEFLDQAASENYLPYANVLSEFVAEDEIATRYANLKAWYEERGHMFLGTGPMFVEQVFPVEGTITLARYDAYPFSSDEWSGFGEPMVAEASVEGPASVTAGEEAVFDVLVDFNGNPYPADDLEGVSYILFNSNNEVVATGQAEEAGEGLYQVTLPADVTSQLEEGGSKLSVAVSSKVVSIPTFATYEFVVTK